MAIITLTRQSGSLGDEIGMLIARRLGYTFYDRKEIERRIVAKGFSPEDLAKYDERKPNIFDRWAKARERYLNYLSMVILEMAQENNCVIMGRGAFLYLADVPNHLTIRFVSTTEARLRHIKELTHTESDVLALKMLKDSDKRQREFYKSSFHYDLKDHSRIHVTINTTLFNPDIMADMIATGIKNTLPTIEEAGEQRIEELIFAQKIANKLIFEQNLHIDELRVTVHGKTITLQGLAAFSAIVERATKIINSEWADYEVISEIKCVQDSHYSSKNKER